MPYVFPVSLLLICEHFSLVLSENNPLKTRHDHAHDWAHDTTHYHVTCIEVDAHFKRKRGEMEQVNFLFSYPLNIF